MKMTKGINPSLITITSQLKPSAREENRPPFPEGKGGVFFSGCLRDEEVKKGGK